MPKVLSEQQIRDFWELGYISPITVMSEHEAAEYLDKLEGTERKYPQHINAENRNNPHLSFAFLDELVHNQIILDAVVDLIGDNIALWGSVLFIKEPQSKGYVSWHQDATYMGICPYRKAGLTPQSRKRQLVVRSQRCGDWFNAAATYFYRRRCA